MQRVTIQQIWNEAWKRFWQNWVPAVTLLPLPFIVGVILAALGGAGVLASVNQIAHGGVWTTLTSVLLLLIYLGITAIGITIFTLGPTQIALSIARGGIRRLQGDVFPSNPLLVFLNTILLWLIYALIIAAMVLVLWIVHMILLFIFSSGSSSDFDDILRFSILFGGEAATLPLVFLLAMAFLIGFYVLTWPSGYLLLSGRNAISVISESIQFMRRHWEVIIAFDLGRLFILIFSLIITGSVMSASLFSSLFRELDLLELSKGSSKGGSMTLAVILILLFPLLLIFLTLIRAVAFTLLHEANFQETNSQEAETQSLHGESAS